MSDCTLHVKVRREFSEGPPDIHEYTEPWAGYSAAEAYRHCLARLRAAGAELVAADGSTIIRRTRRDGWTDTETLTFVDDSPVQPGHVTPSAPDQPTTGAPEVEGREESDSSRGEGGAAAGSAPVRPAAPPGPPH